MEKQSTNGKTKKGTGGLFEHHRKEGNGHTFSELFQKVRQIA